MNRIDHLAARIDRAHAAGSPIAADLDAQLLCTRASTVAEMTSKARLLLKDLNKEHGSHVSWWIAELAASVAEDARRLSV